MNEALQEPKRRCPDCSSLRIESDWDHDIGGWYICTDCGRQWSEQKPASSPAAQVEGDCQDANVNRVIEKHRQRAAAGLSKYGVTTERTDLSRLQWLQHAQDEALDLAVYLERLMSEEPTSAAAQVVGKY